MAPKLGGQASSGVRLGVLHALEGRARAAFLSALSLSLSHSVARAWNAFNAILTPDRPDILTGARMAGRLHRADRRLGGAGLS
eukprot:scaffold81358_cov60-Phaeocystis_antarctica.AAC.2